MIPTTYRCLLIALLSLCASACATSAPRAAQTEPATAAAEPATDAGTAAPEIAPGSSDQTAEEQPATEAGDAQDESLTPAQQAEIQLHVMTGELAAGRKQPETAAKEFLLALKLLDDAALAQRATSLALAARNEELAMRAAKRWQQLAPNEADPREVIARLALNKGDLDEAYGQCAIIVGGTAGGPGEGFRQVAQILSLAGKEQSADVLKLMQRLTSKWTQLPEAQQALGMLALRFDNLPLADFAARQALSLEPERREALLLLAGIRVRQARFDESDEIIGNLIKRSKDRSELRLGYFKLLLENGARERAREQLKMLLQADPKNGDARYALGVLAYNDRDFDQAASQFEPLLGGPRTSEAAFQLGRIEEQRKDYPKALNYYELVIEGPQMLDATVRRAVILSQTGQLPQSHELMQDLRNQFPQYLDRFYLAEAEMLSDAGLPEEALKVYDEAFKQAPDNPELLYGRSLLYERQNQIDLAEQDLRKILKQDADDARTMNALGYMLTVHTRRLKEAKRLIDRAYELQPDDGAIMDSMGWLEYKLGDSSAARDLLTKALDKLPDPEIAAHLGEVLWTLGEQDQARAVWDKALSGNPDHRVLKETVQRYLNP